MIRASVKLESSATSVIQSTTVFAEEALHPEPLILNFAPTSNPEPLDHAQLLGFLALGHKGRCKPCAEKAGSFPCKYGPSPKHPKPEPETSSQIPVQGFWAQGPSQSGFKLTLRIHVHK